MNAIKAKKPGLATFLAQGRLIELKEGELVIGVKGTAFQREQIEKQENRQVIEADCRRTAGAESSDEGAGRQRG